MKHASAVEMLDVAHSRISNYLVLFYRDSRPPCDIFRGLSSPVRRETPKISSASVYGPGLVQCGP